LLRQARRVLSTVGAAWRKPASATLAGALKSLPTVAQPERNSTADATATEMLCLMNMVLPLEFNGRRRRRRMVT
jgi:hypothetical protein